METKTQLSVILTNAPGELAKLCDVLKGENVNILAMSIQNAKDSVKELYNMREKTGRRIAYKICDADEISFFPYPSSDHASTYVIPGFFIMRRGFH